MFKIILTQWFLFVIMNAAAAFVPAYNNHLKTLKPAGFENITMELSVSAFEQLTGKKLNGLQKWQYKMLQKQLRTKATLSIFPKRDELTEGFQPWPFYGTMLSFGLLFIVMIFTARDKNSLRWSAKGLGVVAIGLALTGLLIAFYLSAL